ncbi:MAG TPA: glycosyltransferase [Phycisphaerae bacterium]|nr:glycosyltransferase [Phycisphaerae bacterium]
MSDPSASSPRSRTVSVIIPAFQCAKTIGKAVRSVLEQTYPAHEIIIVDDGSTDDLDSALAPFAGKIVLLRKPNSGASAARNMGLERARGEFIAFLDADDVWLPTKLQRQMEIFERHPEVGIVGTAWYQQPMDGRPQRLANRKQFAIKRFLDRPIAGTPRAIVDLVNRLCTITIVVRRSVLGADRFAPELRMGEDRDLFLRVVARTSAYVISEPLATVWLLPGSVSRAPGKLDDDCRDLLLVDRRNAALVGARGRRQSQSFVYYKWARGHLRAGRPRAALKPAWARVGVEPWSVRAWWTAMRAAILSCFRRS